MSIVITVARKRRQCYIWAGMSCLKGPHIHPLPELFTLTLPVFFVVCINNPPFRPSSKVLRCGESEESRSVRSPTQVLAMRLQNIAVFGHLTRFNAAAPGC